MILLAAGAFLLLGKENTAVLRSLGRYYGRFLRLKNELMSEVSRAVDLPRAPAGSPPLTLRQSILGWESEVARTSSGVPAAVATPALPPVAIARPFGEATTTAPGVGPYTWSMSLTTAATEAREP